MSKSGHKEDQGLCCQLLNSNKWQNGENGMLKIFQHNHARYHQNLHYLYDYFIGIYLRTTTFKCIVSTKSLPSNWRCTYSWLICVWNAAISVAAWKNGACIVHLHSENCLFTGIISNMNFSLRCIPVNVTHFMLSVQLSRIFSLIIFNTVYHNLTTAFK